MPESEPSSASAVSLESVLCTEELNRRPSRPPDYEAESRALVKLAQGLVDSPHTILQQLADTILEVFKTHSAGVSLLTMSDGGKHFVWPAIAGMWKPHIGGGTPRDFGPCGDVLDRDAPLLFNHFERRYTYFKPVTPPVEECLLVPFHVDGKAVGTIWAIAHDKHRKFDAEDLRMLVSLGTFASAAYQVWNSIETLEIKDQALRRSEHRLEDEVAERTLQLNAAHVRLRQADRMATVGTMAAGLAHDITNVTMPLGMRLEAILSNPKLDTETKSALAAVTALVDHLRLMSKDLSLFSRDPSREGSGGRTDLTQWAESVKGLMEVSIADGTKRAGRWIRMNWDVPAGLPLVGVAPHRLTQAVVNLVHNAQQAIVAARAAEAGGKPQAPNRGVIAIQARSSDDRNWVVLSISDDGIGMDEEVRLRCIEPFFTTKDRSAADANEGGSEGGLVSGGSGMGMSIAVAITERVGGHMDIESEPGEGTRISLTLPVALDRPTAEIDPKTTSTRERSSATAD